MPPTNITQIGKYSVLEIIGRGGMGVVFKATDPSLHRPVAIKMIRAFEDNPGLLKRFYQEAHSTGNLHHPNIVTVYDMGEHEGNPYIVMQFLEGESLQELIDQQRDLPLLLRIGHCFEVTGGDLFAFAGLWDGWKDANGNWVKTCSILTTTPNAVTSAIHDRMLVILHPDSYDLWLDPGMQNVAAMAELLKPYYGRQMRCYPVSSRVNDVGNDGEECSRPLDITEAQNRLFA